MNELIQTIKQITPYIWEATVRQQKLEGFIFVVLSIILLFFGVVSIVYEKHSADQDGKWYVIGGCSLAVCGLFVVLGSLYLLNPEYWAIKDLMP